MLRPTPRSSPLALAALGLLAVAPACRAAAPPEPTVSRTERLFGGSPQRAIERIRSGVTDHGWRVVDEGLDSLVVDFGASPARVDVDGAAGGPPGPLRETEVHCTALYIVRRAGTDTAVTVLDNPIYWHPDERIWLPGPRGVAPGGALLGELAAPAGR